ncbi:MAG: hypothetical protein R3325_03285 [Thermoanaerobaculia bacterium]|nr:hypothetical protein [Thermoanaerobaculia bacterium]
MEDRLLLLKLLVTPSLMAAATLAQRRWGARAGGLIAGLPLTAGPVSVFLAVEQGPGFAAVAARGTLVGLVALAGFCLAYARAAPRLRWPASLAAGLGVHAGLTALLLQTRLAFLPAVPASALVVAVLLGARWLGPRRAPPSVVPRRAPRWDLPARAAVSAAVVIGLTALAQRLGPAASGILAPFPVFAGILAAFTHRIDGAAGVQALLGGVLAGSFAYATFFLVVSLMIPRVGLPATFSTATILTALTQMAVAAVLSRRAVQP